MSIAEIEKALDKNERALGLVLHQVTCAIEFREFSRMNEFYERKKALNAERESLLLELNAAEDLACEMAADEPSDEPLEIDEIRY